MSADRVPSGRSRVRASLSTHVARLRVHYRGFAFAEPVDGSPSLFVNSRLLTGFVDGDVVEVKVKTGTDDAAGVKLIERPRNTVVGEVAGTKGRRRLVVDQAIGDLTVPLRAGGCQLSSGVSVEAFLSVDGDRWVATALEVLGDPLSDESLTRRVMTRHQFPVGHAESVVAAAVEVAQVRRRASNRRRDLTDLTVVTIDDDHSQDLDDALSAMATPSGGIRVWVHVTDVTEYVPSGSVLDVAAAQTATSVYLATGVRHMFPEQVAADRLSLVPKVERDVVTVELAVAADGSIRAVDVYEAVVRSTQRLNYEQVTRLIRDGSRAGRVAVPDVVREQVALLWAAASRLGLARAARGGLDASRVDGERDRAGGVAHLLVERLMVAANEAVAKWLDDRMVPALYRTHPPLGDDEADQLEEVASALGLFAALSRPVTPLAIAALAAQAAPTVQVDRFWDATLKVLSRARYEATPGLHFGLGSQCYVHFTSPLRRYADMVVHRAVKSYLAGERDAELVGLVELASHVSDRSQSAAAAERDLDRALALRDIAVGSVCDAVVLSSTHSQCRVLVADVVGVLSKFSARPGTRVEVEVEVADPLSGRLEVTSRKSLARGKSARVQAKQTVSTSPTQAAAGAAATLDEGAVTVASSNVPRANVKTYRNAKTAGAADSSSLARRESSGASESVPESVAAAAAPGVGRTDVPPSCLEASASSVRRAQPSRSASTSTSDSPAAVVGEVTSASDTSPLVPLSRSARRRAARRRAAADSTVSEMTVPVSSVPQ